MSETTTALTADDLKKLAEPFPKDMLGVKVQSYAKDRKTVQLVTYISHTDVASRLDQVDPAWVFETTSHSREGDTFIVHARLTVKGVTRTNVGEGDTPKSALSDALKRCATMFGVCRYMYDMPKVWAPFNERTDKSKQWSMADYDAALAKKSPPAARPPAQRSAGPSGPMFTDDLPRPLEQHAPAPAAKLARASGKPAVAPKPTGRVAPVTKLPQQLSRDDLSMEAARIMKLLHMPEGEMIEIVQQRYQVLPTQLTNAQIKDFVDYLGKLLHESGIMGEPA